MDGSYPHPPPQKELISHSESLASSSSDIQSEKDLTQVSSFISNPSSEESHSTSSSPPSRPSKDLVPTPLSGSPNSSNSSTFASPDPSHPSSPNSSHPSSPNKFEDPNLNHNFPLFLPSAPPSSFEDSKNLVSPISKEFEIVFDNSSNNNNLPSNHNIQPSPNDLLPSSNEDKNWRQSTEEDFSSKRSSRVPDLVSFFERMPSQNQIKRQPIIVPFDPNFNPIPPELEEPPNYLVRNLENFQDGLPPNSTQKESKKKEEIKNTFRKVEIQPRKKERENKHSSKKDEVSLHDNRKKSSKSQRIIDRAAKLESIMNLDGKNKSKEDIKKFNNIKINSNNKKQEERIKNSKEMKSKSKHMRKTSSVRFQSPGQSSSSSSEMSPEEFFDPNPPTSFQTFIEEPSSNLSKKIDHSEEHSNSDSESSLEEDEKIPSVLSTNSWREYISLKRNSIGPPIEMKKSDFFWNTQTSKTHPRTPELHYFNTIRFHREGPQDWSRPSLPSSESFGDLDNIKEGRQMTFEERERFYRIYDKQHHQLAMNYLNNSSNSHYDWKFRKKL